MNGIKLKEKRELEGIIVSGEATILDAMKAIDEGAAQIALFVDDEEKLFGLITDGDIRRTSRRG